MRTRWIGRTTAAIAALALAVMAGCSGSDAAPRPMAANIRITSGDSQITQVAAAKLGNPVGAYLYRTPTGVAFYSPQQVASILAQAVLPNALNAQTLQGAPYPNQVVCWAQPTGVPALVTATPCANTDSNGHVAFELAPGTAAGWTVGYVAWDSASAGVTKLTDSVHTLIEPGALVSAIDANQEYVNVGDTLSVDSLFRWRDQYGNLIDDSLMRARSIVRTAWVRDSTWAGGPGCPPPAAPIDSGWITVAPYFPPQPGESWEVSDSAPQDTTWYPAPNACLYVWVDDGTTPMGPAVFALTAQ